VSGSATINNTALNNNQSPSTASDGTGGAVFVDLGGTATISHSQFSNNLAGFGGGAVSSQNGNSSFSIDTSTFTSNSGTSGGGAVYPNGTSASISNSTFINNSANVGGALHSNATTVTVTNSTFVGNAAVTLNGNPGNDGAIDSRQGRSMSITALSLKIPLQEVETR